MKNLKFVSEIILAGLLFVLPLAGCSNEQEQQSMADAKPYPLNTCLVCGMKLGEMGKPYTFVYQGQQIEVCDKSEKSSFDKDPAKYMKKLADAEAALKK